MSRAFVFPGQGSQSVGMGKDLFDAFPAAREVFQEIDDALDQKLSALMFGGPEDELTLTENAQPALMAVSMAVMAVLRTEGGVDLAKVASFVAGHSLGEYSALAAAGAFTLADTARLLKTRGQAMQQAVPVGAGAMAALIGLDLDGAKAVVEEVRENDVLATANDNAPGQIVISGNREAVERALVVAKEKGAKMAVLLQVSAPFHCPLMAPAAEVMAGALAEVTVRPPLVPLIANVTAAPVEDPVEIRRLLVDQVTGMVRWRECCLTMKDKGVHTLIEVGSGKVLTGLAKRIDRELAATTIGTPAGVEAFLASL